MILHYHRIILLNLYLSNYVLKKNPKVTLIVRFVQPKFRSLARGMNYIATTANLQHLNHRIKQIVHHAPFPHFLVTNSALKNLTISILET